MAESPTRRPKRLDQTLGNLLDQVAEKRRANQEHLKEQGYPPDVVRELEAEAQDPVGDETRVRPQRYRGRSHHTIVERAQLSLFEGERGGKYAKLPLSPSSEFPSMLARLPVFVPGRRTTQRQMVDRENALPFETPWGKGRKHGPPLTVYDEDTLMVLGMLRQSRLTGSASTLPIGISDVLSQGRDVHVHVLFTTLSEIEGRFGNSKNGKMFASRLESIKRLASTRIEFESLSDKAIARGTIVSLLDVAWERWEKEAVLYIQFSPVMAYWYENAYSYVDWNVRMSLHDTGKALHRFLSSQPKEYEIYTEKLRQTIGYPREPKYFIRDLRVNLKRLVELEWLKEFDIEGNGRGRPHKLIVQRR